MAEESAMFNSLINLSRLKVFKITLVFIDFDTNTFLMNVTNRIMLEITFDQDMTVGFCFTCEHQSCASAIKKVNKSRISLF